MNLIHALRTSLLSGLAPLAAWALPEWIDLNLAPGSTTNAPGVTAYGRAAGERMGSSIHAGDINGDGLTDLIVGAPQAEDPGLGLGDDRGQVYIVLGRANLPPRIDLAGLEGPGAGVRISGAGAGDELSRNNALFTADVNGDGRQDLILGAPLAEGPGNQRSNGGEA